MFLISEIARLFTCVKGKSSYLVPFGWAPYFYNELTNAYQVYFFIVSDLSKLAYNRVTEMEQQDFAIRYWNVILHKFASRCERSEFLGNSTDENLFERFNKATAQLDHQKVIHLSMDGSAINN